jgi:iron complex transport system permease protein
MNRRLPYPVVLVGLALLAAGFALVSLMAGSVWIAPGRLLTLGHDPLSTVVVELRLPRTVLGLMVGATLGLCGAALQGYTRNPLADPALLGVSSTAALGAVATLYFGLVQPWALPVFAMVGAVGGVVGLLLLADSAGGTVSFLLAGAVLNVVASAGVAAALSLAPNPWASSEITTWLLGSLANRSNADVQTALPFIILGGLMVLSTGRDLDALSLGETGARALGVSLPRLQAVLAAGVGLACGAGVAVTGMIGFVGLITPHLLRPFVGERPSRLLAPSALAGAALLVAADTLVRVAPASGGELSLGVAMSVLGGPFFLVLLLSLRRTLA